MQPKGSYRNEVNNNEKKDSSRPSTPMNSSDEDLNSDNEKIDLRPLCRGRLLSDSSSDEEEKEKSNKNEVGAISIELTPYTPSKEKDEEIPFQALIDQLKSIKDKAEKDVYRQELIKKKIIISNPFRLADSEFESDESVIDDSVIDDSEIDESIDLLFNKCFVEER